jgi:glycosyltransferase involved in cell wall biosynthesis
VGTPTPHVILVAAPVVPGGVSGHLLGLLEHRAPGRRHTLVLPDRPALAPCARRAQELDVTVLRIGDWRRRGVDAHATWLRDAAPDLVHLHFSDPFDLVPVLEATAALRLPAVTSDHLVASGRWGHGTATARERRRRASRTVVASVADSRAIATGLVEHLGLDAARVRVIHHGVDTRRFAPADRAAARRALGLDPTRRHVGCVGLLVSAKRFDRAIRALRDLPGDIVLHLLGDGPERPRLIALARRQGAPVHVHGWRDDVARWLVALDLLVHPSETEGFPSALLEAMASGCPVVATAVGGVPELLDGGRRGWLVEVPDDGDGDEDGVEALTLGMARALAARDTRRGRGSIAHRSHLSRPARAREAVCRLYSMRRTARRIDALHGSILEAVSGERQKKSAPARCAGAPGRALPGSLAHATRDRPAARHTGPA